MSSVWGAAEERERVAGGRARERDIVIVELGMGRCEFFGDILRLVLSKRFNSLYILPGALVSFGGYLFSLLLEEECSWVIGG